ncbi:hypothetical protein [Streptomyces sp. R41]|uniref:Ricin B lectin domain-containing protein n=1 Tax=Streptomyces sp. R41 TaxID=3238632 RepID=A0AB39RDM5_9ACTN
MLDQLGLFNGVLSDTPNGRGSPDAQQTHQGARPGCINAVAGIAAKASRRRVPYFDLLQGSGARRSTAQAPGLDCKGTQHMFSRQKIATVSGLLGSLAVIYVGAAQAYADEPPGDCKSSALGETTCIRKSETVHIDEDGRIVVKQMQDCETTDRPRLVGPDNDLLNTGSTKVGPVVNCSNKAQLPKGFKRPHFDF